MKRILILFILLGLLVSCTVKAPTPAPAPTPQEPVEEKPNEPINASHQESLRRFAQMSASAFFEDNGENHNYSPLSLNIALSMLVQGSEGETREDILRTMGFEGIDVNEVTSLMKSQIAKLSQESEEGTVLLANALFSEEGFPLKESFIEKLKNDFGALAESVKLTDKSGVARINNFIAERTANRIKDAYQADPESGDVLLLINTLYAKLP